MQNNIKGGSVEPSGKLKFIVKMEFEPVETPYYTKYLLPEFVAILPRRGELLRILKLTQRHDTNIGNEKSLELNDSIYRKLISLLSNGFWKDGCVDKLKHLLAWIDCRRTCWRRYRFVLKRFRYRLSATINLIEKRKRWLHRRTPKNVWLQSDSQILMELESTPWAECKEFFLPTKSNVRKLINSSQMVEPVEDDEFDDDDNDEEDTPEDNDGDDGDSDSTLCDFDEEDEDTFSVSSKSSF